MQPNQWYDDLILYAAPRTVWRAKFLTKVKVMAWTSPVFEEVVLCCEINSYVSAKL
jgi:hypothetical protein